MAKKKANGEGSIYKDKKNNRWRGSLSVGRKRSWIKWMIIDTNKLMTYYQ